MKLLITHGVADRENWLARRPQRVADLAPFGSQITDHVALDGGNAAAVSLEVHDLDGLRAELAAPSPARAASIAEQGIEAPFQVFVEVE
jgi:hypothetical protein